MPEQRRRKHVSKWVVLAIVAFIVGDLLGVLMPALESLRAEHTLHDVGFACVLVAEFRESHQAWPNGWEDLRQVGAGRSWLDHTWPDDAVDLEKRVAIDFTSLPSDPCGAVSPIGICYDHTATPGFRLLQEVSEAVVDSSH